MKEKGQKIPKDLVLGHRRREIRVQLVRSLWELNLCWDRSGLKQQLREKSERLVEPQSLPGLSLLGPDLYLIAPVQTVPQASHHYTALRSI